MIRRLSEHAKKEYERLGNKKLSDGSFAEAWAEACLECGECEPKCPQNIPIIEQLKETAEALKS